MVKRNGEMEKWTAQAWPPWLALSRPPPLSTKHPALGVGLSAGGSQRTGTGDREWWFPQRQRISGNTFASVGQLTGSEGVKGPARLKR